MEQQKYKSFTSFFLFACSISTGTLSWSYSVNQLNDALETVEALLSLTNPYLGLKQGVLVTSITIGAFIGVILSFSKIKSTPRRRFMQIIDITFIFGCLLTCISSYWIMVLGRLVQGLGCGMSSVVIPLYLKEISPSSIYSIIGGENLVFYGTGTVLCNVIGLFFPENPKQNVSNISPIFWRFYFCVPIIFCLIRIFLLTFVYTLDTPEFNQANKNYSDVKKFVIKYYKKEYLDEVLLQYEQNDQDKQTDVTLKQLFSLKEYKKRFRLGILLNIAQQTSGANAVISYSTIIFQQYSSTQTARILSLMLAVQKIFFYSTTVAVLQKFGRRRPILAGTSILVATNVILFTTSYLLDNELINSHILKQIAVIVAISCIFIFFIGFFHSLGTISVYIPEFLPQKGVVFALGFQWMFSIMITLTFPVIKQYLGIVYCFGLYAVLTTGSLIQLLSTAKETQGLNENQISALFQSKANYYLENSSYSQVYDSQ